nr:unnamed protein product [Digitaria exilis]
MIFFLDGRDWVWLGFGCGGELGGGEGDAMKVAAAGSFGGEKQGRRRRPGQARPPRKEKKKVLPAGPASHAFPCPGLDTLDGLLEASRQTGSGPSPPSNRAITYDLSELADTLRMIMDSALESPASATDWSQISASERETEAQISRIQARHVRARALRCKARTSAPVPRG